VGAPFCSLSVARATFRLAMISIGSGLKTHASQRSRNNWLTVEMEDGAPANYWANRKAPPHRGVYGAGGMASDLTD
jgi:hypothetical protein